MRIAASITSTGQVVNRTVARKVNEFCQKAFNMPNYNFIVAGDTDSFYITIDPLIQKIMPDETDKFKVAAFVDKVIKEKLMPVIEAATTGTYQYMNHMQNKQKYDREVIAESAVWKCKKNYSMMVIDNEGVIQTKPKKKVMGLIAKKSICPEWSAGYLMECYELAMMGEEVDIQERVQDIQEAFEWMSLSEIAVPTGVNGVEKWACPHNIFLPKTPHHVKAALYHNKIVADNGWRHILPIKSGDKIKMLPLKQPNKYNIKKIAFVDHLPPEFDLELDVDRLKIFKDKFIKPLQDYLDSVGWSHKRVAKITSLMR